MRKSKRPNKEQLTEDLKQNWTFNQHQNFYYDQFHFKISVGEMYGLYHHGVFIAKCYTLSACREISTIILNDLIMSLPLEKTA